jgi:1-aminocyclopropane-1-carboxylate deaminase/D-cysteine desulfhydrase-like pyridoxal-dependent ACC family enzyme
VSVLFELFPVLARRTPRVSLGTFPTPVEDATRVLVGEPSAGELWLKRDDVSSEVYGGNKVRLLEHLLGAARERGASVVYSTGAMGSNFALATALHAPRAGLEPRAICFPQSLTSDAERSQRAVSQRALVIEVPHWSLLPLAASQARRRAKERGERIEVLSQVGMAPEALFGYVGAGLELAQQIARGECPAPARVVLPIGSAATSAGILAGLSLATRLGVLPSAPALCAVRIAAFPLSRRGRVLSLAEATLRRLADLTGQPGLALQKRELSMLEIVTNQLGPGYAEPTPAGRAAREAFARAGYSVLDDTYTAKAAAHVLAIGAAAGGPTLFWCTKSSVVPD